MEQAPKVAAGCCLHNTPHFDQPQTVAIESTLITNTHPIPTRPSSPPPSQPATLKITNLPRPPDQSPHSTTPKPAQHFAPHQWASPAYYLSLELPCLQLSGAFCVYFVCWKVVGGIYKFDFHNLLLCVIIKSNTLLN